MYTNDIRERDDACNKENTENQTCGSIGMGEMHVHRRQLTTEQIEARRANARARYANLTPKERQAIRDRQRLLYSHMTSEQK
ncbi:hypothetical protein U9M48_016317 [Paspalum notatum var. saurae]|uniref:Uncharacterized protein n=1 Tax=Paspalum notatum var. saurae TaxID=547442 RepID=A0AAQ3T6T3_PASNO